MSEKTESLSKEELADFVDFLGKSNEYLQQMTTEKNNRWMQSHHWYDNETGAFGYQTICLPEGAKIVEKKHEKPIEELCRAMGVPERIYRGNPEPKELPEELRSVDLCIERDGMKLTVTVSAERMKYLGENIRAFWTTAFSQFIDYMKKPKLRDLIDTTKYNRAPDPTDAQVEDGIAKCQFIADELGSLKTTITDEERKEIEAWYNAKYNLGIDVTNTGCGSKPDNLEGVYLHLDEDSIIPITDPSIDWSGGLADDILFDEKGLTPAQVEAASKFLQSKRTKNGLATMTLDDPIDPKGNISDEDLKKMNEWFTTHLKVRSHTFEADEVDEPIIKEVK